MHFVRRPFEFPEPLSRTLAEHFFKTTEPQLAALRPMSRLLAELWPVLAQGRGQQGASDSAGKKHYSFGKNMVEAYAAYYLPANAMKVPLVLEEIRAFGLPLLGDQGSKRALRWLDVGAGPGTALWGLAWWGKHRGVRVDYKALEQSREFVDVATALSRKLEVELFGSKNDCMTASFEVFQQGKSEGGGLAARVRAFDPDVLSFVNSIGELVVDEHRRSELMSEVLDALASRARVDGRPRWLVIIEPGSKAASRELARGRDTWLRRKDARIWLPCLSARPCGALAREDDWCHEEAAVEFPNWMTQLGAAAGLRKEAVLFSYLVVSVGDQSGVLADWPERGQRVVSQLMREKGLVQCFLCTSDRGKVRARLLNSRRDDANAGFSEAVRGQVFSDIELGEKGDVLRYVDCGASSELDTTVFPPLR